MYKVMSQHYNGRTEVMHETADKEDAHRFMRQQAEIVKGYHKRTGWVGDMFVVFGKGDIFKTKFWVSGCK